LAEGGAWILKMYIYLLQVPSVKVIGRKAECMFGKVWNDSLILVNYEASKRATTHRLIA